MYSTFNFNIWLVSLASYLAWWNPIYSRKTAEAAPSLQQNLGTLAFHFSTVVRRKKRNTRWAGDIFVGVIDDFDAYREFSQT